MNGAASSGSADLPHGATLVRQANRTSAPPHAIPRALQSAARVASTEHAGPIPSVERERTDVVSPLQWRDPPSLIRASRTKHHCKLPARPKRVFIPDGFHVVVRALDDRGSASEPGSRVALGTCALTWQPCPNRRAYDLPPPSFIFRGLASSLRILHDAAHPLQHILLSDGSGSFHRGILDPDSLRRFT